MSFNEREAAEWTQGVEQENAKLLGVVDKSLSDAAARGFAEPPGENLDAILQASQDAKDKLVLVNGKIYDDRRAILFSEYEFSLKIAVRIATLAMELYRQEIFNALEIEQAEVQAAFRRGEADVKRLNSQIEKREVAIIMDRAAAQNQIAILKAQLVVAQQGTLPYESALIAAQLETEEMRLQIIASLWQIIAAQKVELVADQARVVALQALLVAERNLVAVQAGTLPYEFALLLAQLTTAQMKLQEIPAINQEIAAEKVGIAADYDKLAADQEVLAAKRILVADQEADLPYDGALIQAQLQTEELRATEIPVINQEIASEYVELAADQDKVAAQEALLTEEQALAAVKLAMVPFYIQKATAEEALAAAETANLPIQEALIKLGYGRLNLQTTTEYVAHLLRVAEEQVKLANATFITVEEANRLLEVQNKVTLENYERANKIQELNSLVANLQARGSDEAITIAASAMRNFMETLIRTSEASESEIETTREVILGG